MRFVSGRCLAYKTFTSLPDGLMIFGVNLQKVLCDFADLRVNLE